MFVLTLLFWLAVAAGILALLAYLSGRHYRLEPKMDAVYFVTTEDGWRLQLTRYRPREPLGGPPVVLCPGAGMSSVIFDVSEETSLARYLSTHGHDVWLLDPRGRGISARRRANWSFDDYVEFDAPAALRLIGEHTGAPQVQWIGFGVGGLIPLAVLPGADGHRIGSLATLAASAFFRRQQAVFGPRLLRWLRRLRLDLVVRLLAPLLGRLYLGALRLLQNRDNIDGLTYRRALVNGLAGFARTETNQYAEWLEQDHFTAMVQRRDYRASLGSIQTPTLFIVGPRDELAPPDMVENTAALLEDVEDRALVIASRMHGMSTNYGHLDLLLGRGVRRDIFSHLLKWVDLHAGVEIPASHPEPPEPREGWTEENGYADRQRSTTQRSTIQAPMESVAESPDAGEDEPMDDGLMDDEDDEDLVQGDVPRVPG